MKITIIATKDIAGLFPIKAGEQIKVIDGDNVKRIEADKKNIKIYFKNGLFEYYHTERVKIEMKF